MKVLSNEDYNFLESLGIKTYMGTEKRFKTSEQEIYNQIKKVEDNIIKLSDINSLQIIKQKIIDYWMTLE